MLLTIQQEPETRITGKAAYIPGLLSVIRFIELERERITCHERDSRRGATWNGLKKHGDTITIIVAVVGAIAFSHYQLGNVHNQLENIHNQLVVIQG